MTYFIPEKRLHHRLHRWEDFDGRRWELNITVRAENLARALDEFGTSHARLDAFARQATKRACAAVQLTYPEASIRFEAEGGSLSLAYSAPSGEMAEVRKLANALLEAESHRYHQECGFLSVEGGMIPDMSRLARTNSARVAGTAAQLASLFGTTGLTGKRALGYLVSFVQSHKYQVPPSLRSDNVDTGGILTPPEMLILGWGDCDSRSLLFASLWLNLTQAPLIFITGDHHMTVAVGGEFAGFGHTRCRHAGNDYLVCELASASPLPPGASHPETEAFLKGPLHIIEVR